ncbi:hypothetical protein [Flavobacterium capsici]|uniref:Uncharacterized protein n=1 Tax=Flavobacterium capsici TaxID=3075618 RepID=A0AA96J137_9FLAO|nr:MULTISPECIES: hypothetical protein [unclassified Flavobacterium]WNM17877.1 hypothetical protein RN608_07610 [Flavobacterium sp. PMR2A8]WNM21930.1 hypothetical protein RN605_00910 [Flavobacterium sp. PMTSA4]
MRHVFRPIFMVATLLFCFLMVNDSYAQRLENNVPIAVMEAFQKKFPIKDPVWFSEFHGRFDQKLTFEARFMFDNRYSRAYYDSEGNMKAFAATVETKELPAKATAYMKENYPTFPIAEAIMVTHSSQKVEYEVGIYIDGVFSVVTFSKDGDFIKMGRG